MFVSKFLRTAAPCEVVQFNRRSMLFAARAAMRSNSVSEVPSISPMTAALVSAADQRTTRPEVPSTSDLVTADVELGTEAQVVVTPRQMSEANKAAKKRKNGVSGAPRRKRLSRKTNAGAEQVGATSDCVQAENSA